MKKRKRITIWAFMAVILAASMIWGSMPLYAHAEAFGETLSDAPLNYRALPGEVKAQSIKASDNRINVGDNVTIPARYDDKNFAKYMPDLRNQGTYGSCWAQTAMALAEISLRKKGLMASANLSEVQLAYFTYNWVSDPLGGTDRDDNSALFSAKKYLQFGGSLEMGARVLASWTGAANEEGDLSYPSGSKKPPTRLNSDYAYNYDTAHLKGYLKVCIDESEGINSPDMRAAKATIMEKGALGVGYHAINATKAKTNTKIYNKKTNAYYDPETYGGVPNHSVTIVGWDDNFSASKFKKRPPGDGAWLVRNSWTTGSYSKHREYAGYFWMSYYNASLGSGALAFDVDTSSNYDNNYQYDGSMTEDEIWEKGVHSAKAANVFKAKASSAGENLKAVSFVSPLVNTDYEVKIYVSNSPVTANPETGELKATLKGKTTFAGYYTVNLGNPIALTPGQYFSVVVGFDTPGRHTRIPFETTEWEEGWYSTTAHVDAGESFVCFDEGWQDVVTFRKGEYRLDIGNVRIKAFTDNNYDPSARMELPAHSLTLQTGKKKSLGVNVYNDKLKLATSSNSNVATASVSGNSLVIKAGKKKGNATITVVSGAGRKDTVKVTVQSGKVTTKKLVLSVKDRTLTGGVPTFTFIATATPNRYSTGEAFKVSSSNNKVAGATINKTTGEVTVTGKKKGSANITVSCGSKKAVCKVRVNM